MSTVPAPAPLAEYVDLRGIAAYHEVTGAGEPLVLLHGGFCSLETLRPQIGPLSEHFRVHAVERPGHGRTPDRPGPFTFDAVVADTVAYLDAVGLGDAHVLGFSDGAIAGLMLAQRHPSRVRSLVAISGNLDPSGLVDEEDAVPQVDHQMRADYGRLSPDGPDHAQVVVDKLARLWREEPHIDPVELASITAPTLVMAGDHDSVRTEHTLAIAAAIPGAQLCIVPGASHLLMLERPALVNHVITDFLTARDARQVG